MPDEISQEDFLSAFGVTNSTEDGAKDDNTDGSTDDGNEPDDVNNTDDAKDSTDDGQNSTDDSDDNSKDDEPDLKGDTPDKASHAFAQLRVENKKNAELLKNIANVLGVQGTSNPEDLYKALNDKVIASQAKAQNIPEDVLRRVNQLEEYYKTTSQEDIKRSALLGFQKVKDTFGLSNKDLEQFAVSMQRDGLSPLEQPLDLVREYKTRNFDNLIKAAEERGAAAEATRAKKAQEHGSTPGNKQGQRKNIGDGEKINTVQALNEFFRAK
jgi:hypothetical protein